MTEDKLQPGQDLDSFLGVSWVDRRVKKRPEVLVECGQSPPKERRHTDWNNFTTFAFGGYLARVTRYHCQCCDNLWDHLEGIFMEETKLNNGTRRLTQLPPNGQWPKGPHRKEVVDAEVPWCGHCIGDLGFEREVGGDGREYKHPFTLEVKP